MVGDQRIAHRAFAERCSVRGPDDAILEFDRADADCLVDMGIGHGYSLLQERSGSPCSGIDTQSLGSFACPLIALLRAFQCTPDLLSHDALHVA
jgi:hypothetical protein